MHIDSRTKEEVKGYCRHSWAAQGKLTEKISDKIVAEDEATLRMILEDQKARIISAAKRIEDKRNKQVTLSQADSVQEVLGNLEELLKC